MTDWLLQISGLNAGYGQTQVLRNVSLDIPQRARVGLFGPNGHGKTTLLRAISGLLRPWSGHIAFSGTRVDGLRPGRIVELGIVQVPQGNTLFPRLTVGETLSLGSYARRARAGAKRNLDLVLTLFPRLAERRGQLCGTLSGGERQMLSIGLGVLTSPRLLILDEPTLGLAPRIKDELCEAIRRLSERDLPLIVVEQDVEFLTESRRYAFHDGARKHRARGSPRRPAGPCGDHGPLLRPEGRGGRRCWLVAEPTPGPSASRTMNRER